LDGKDSAPPATPERRSSTSKPTAAPTWSLLVWIIAALAAIGIAVAVGWFIGRTL
jgi:hypothetical protein